MNKERIIKYIESLEIEANKSNQYFKERNELYIKNQKQKKVLDKIKEKIKENNNYLLNAKDMYCIEVEESILKTTVLQLINNNLVQNDELLEMLEE